MAAHILNSERITPEDRAIFGDGSHFVRNLPTFGVPLTSRVLRKKKPKLELLVKNQGQRGKPRGK